MRIRFYITLRYMKSCLDITRGKGMHKKTKKKQINAKKFTKNKNAPAAKLKK